MPCSELPDVDVVQFQRRRNVVKGALSSRLFRDDPPNHELGNLGHREVLDVIGVQGLAVTHDRDGVGDFEELIEPVRDIDDGHAARGQPPNDREQDTDFSVGQDRRGFIKNQDACVSRHCLGDGNLLLLCDGQVTDRGRGQFVRQADHVQQLVDLGGLRGPVDTWSALDFAANEDVLRDAQLGEELRFLIDRLDAEL